MDQSKQFKAFSKLVNAVLTVPAETVKRRVEDHRREALRNPGRPGPKPAKVKASASDHADPPDRA